MAAPIQYDELCQQYEQTVISRVQAVHDAYVIQGGKSRDKYMERLGLEFAGEDISLSRADFEVIDGWIEHKRWFKQRSRALYRDWERDKRELKEKTVRMIEDEVEETKGRLLKDLE